MRKLTLSVVSLGLLSIGFMFGSLVSNGEHGKVEQSYKSKIDSLNLVIEDKDWQIDELEESCQEKESEISYWGRLYDNCRGIEY